MSYILDALNKSERERRKARAPGLDTVHRGTTRPPPASRPWIIGIVLLAAINGGFLAYWFGTRTPIPVTPTAQGSPTHTPADMKSQSAQPPVIANTNPRQSAGSQSAPSASQQTPKGQLVTPTDALANGSAGTARTGDAALTAVKISDLPVDVQQQIPDMTFSSHIYSDDAKYRMVNINGKLLHEGDMVADGIRLVRITEDGVVLTFEGYTFKVSVLHDWSFN